MIDQILKRSNLLRAMYKVRQNHGSAGVDHMPVTKLTDLMIIEIQRNFSKAKNSSNSFEKDII